MKKRDEKKIFIISIIVIIILAVIIILSVVKPEKAGGFWAGLKGELATLIRPGEILVPEGLVAYYKFDGTARDELGTHHGEVHGAELTTGVSGQAGDRAYEFASGGDYIFGSPDYIEEDYINIPFRRRDELDFSTKKEITTSFWMDLSEIPPDNHGGSRPLYWEDYSLTAHEKTKGTERIEWFAEDSGRGYYKLSWRVMNQLGEVSEVICNKRVGYDEWHLFTGIYDGALTKIYMDGKVCGADFMPGTILPTMSGTNGWVISDAAPNKKLGIVGKMDEVRIYNRALSDSEIALLYLGGLEVDVVRDITSSYGRYSVTLDISTTRLIYNEIMIITEKVPDGLTVAQGSWNIEPTHVFDDTLVWLFANNPPMYYGYINVSQEIPSSISYEVSGTSGEEFKGKWGFEIIDIDGFITGENTL